MNAVEFERVSFAYNSRPNKKTLHDLSLTVRKGEFVGLVGCTGAGKSTLLYCINRVIPSMVEGKLQGKVKVNEKNVGGKSPSDFAGEIGLLFQDPDSQLFAPTVRDEIEFGLENLGVHKDEREWRVSEALGLVGLDGFEAFEPHELSFGQRQKVALACVLAMKPEIVLLDEPVSALDWKSAIEIYEVLRKLNREGKTIVVVEHNTELLSEYAKRVIMLHKGKVGFDGSPEALFSSSLAEEAGLKVPCAVKIGREIGVSGGITPASLVEMIRGGRARGRRK